MDSLIAYRAASRRRRGRLTVATVLGFSLFAACGSSSTSTGSPNTPDPKRVSTSSTSKPAKASAVTISGYAFMPKVATVPAGEITIENKDPEVHTFTSGTTGKPDGVFDVRVVPGEPARVTVKPGTYSYFCQIHGNMSGTLVVQ